MRFKAINELKHFEFKDGIITEIERTSDCFRFSLEGVIVKEKNSQNEQMTASYAGPMELRFLNGKITEVFKEGHKYYDMNNVLLEEVADEMLSEQEIDALIKTIKAHAGDAFLFTIEEQESKEIDGSENSLQMAQMCVDIEEGNFWFTVQYEKSIAEWDKYLNRVFS